MSLRDVIDENLVSCNSETPISEVADLMKDEDVGAVVVVDENRKPIGIVTDRDIVVRCISESRDPNTPVGTIMTASVASVGIDAELHDVVRVMKERGVRRIPVVDQNSFAVGLISFGDLFGLIAKEMSELSATTAVRSAA
jgi:signal-transduction protein with cAMP-binding, CBS, and nucleotidyltransferase domain